MNDPIDVVGAVLGGANLVLLLNIVLNHLKHIEQKLDEHLRDHRLRAEQMLDEKNGRKEK